MKGLANCMWVPVTLNLTHKNILIIGAGKVALRKLQSCSGKNAHITVVSPEILPKFSQLMRQQQGVVYQRMFKNSDLHGQDFVFIMTNNKDENARIVQLCQKKKILFNCATGDEQNFLMASFFTRGHLMIAVSTGGKIPFLAKTICQFLQTLFDKSWNHKTKKLAKLRETLLAKHDYQKLAQLKSLSYEELLKKLGTHL